MDNNSTSPKNCKPNDFKEAYGISQIVLHSSFSRHFDECWGIMQSEFHGKVCLNKKKTKIVTINFSNHLMHYISWLLGFVEYRDKPHLKIRYGDIIVSSKQSERAFSRDKVMSFNLQLTALGLLTVIRKTGIRRLNYHYFAGLLEKVKRDGIILEPDDSKLSHHISFWVSP